ncbi:9549_t:CDS:1 [Cetraspora pellucida]|uniref:9549_t:CDS:1 n=1 Tax=Cetraspora pellucida TaxID=1433469 RepID=A0ACA9JYX9_9GLOM|nr:9549_t:CDS:1 [Cetraspora pellucida]
MLQEVENGQRAEDLKMNVLQAIHFIIQGWDEVKANTIRNCWYQTKILSADANSDLRSSLEDFRQTTNPVLNDIADALNALDLLNPMQVEEYLAIPEENIVYEVPSNDQVITELVETFRTNEPTNIDLEDEDDSFEAPIVSANTAIASLETMRTFLLQQDCTEEYVNLIRRIEKFIKKTKVGQMQQSRIDQFFVEDN